MVLHMRDMFGRLNTDFYLSIYFWTFQFIHFRFRPFYVTPHFQKKWKPLNEVWAAVRLNEELCPLLMFTDSSAHSQGRAHWEIFKGGGDLIKNSNGSYSVCISLLLWFAAVHKQGLHSHSTDNICTTFGLSCQARKALTGCCGSAAVPPCTSLMTLLGSPLRVSVYMSDVVACPRYALYTPWKWLKGL